MSAEPLLKVQDLSVTFRNGDRETVAAQGVSYELAAGEVLAVVGESGSGKSVTALALTRLLPPAPGCVLGGSVRLQGVELLTLPENQLAKVRGGSIAYIFQEPGSSLNPVYTIGFQIGEAISLHRPEIKDVRAEVIRALTEVHINDPARVAEQYPHELSGGMQQRAMIAMALACDPKILVADESDRLALGDDEGDVVHGFLRRGFLEEPSGAAGVVDGESADFEEVVAHRETLSSSERVVRRRRRWPSRGMQAISALV